MPPESEHQAAHTQPRANGEERSDSVTEHEEYILEQPPEEEDEQQPYSKASADENGSDGRDATPHDGETAAEMRPEELTTEQWLEKLAIAEALAAERLEGQQRSLADFQNYKRRTTRDMQLIHQNASASLLANFFPIVDDLSLALASLPTTGDGVAWSEGVNMIQRKLMSVLESENVAVIEAEPGQEFDPHFHEAIVQEEHDVFDSDLIIAVVRPGYRLGERVLRPAQVRVAK